MFWKTKDPAHDWIAKKAQRELNVDRVKASELIKEIKEWNGYNETLTDLFRIYPAKYSIPILTYALAVFIPTGYLELGRAPGRLAATYKREGATTVLKLVKDGPDPSLHFELSKIYNNSAIYHNLAYFYWILANALRSVSEYCSHSEIEDAVEIIEGKRNIWMTIGFQNDIVEMLQGVRRLGNRNM